LPFRESRDLIERLEVVISSLPLLLVPNVLDGAELDRAAVAQPPHVLGAVEIPSASEQLERAVDEALQLDVLPPEDDRPPVV